MRNSHFHDLIFTPRSASSNPALKLTYYMNSVNHKLSCRRSLTSTSSINSNSSSIWAPNVLECDDNILYFLSNSNALGCAVIGSNTMNLSKTTLFLYYGVNFDTYGITFPSLSFKAIFNYTHKNKSAFTFLNTSNWIPNA